MAENDQERTEQPTSRRREEARDEGRFAVSKELSSFFAILGGLAVLYSTGLWMAMGLVDVMKRSFGPMKGELTVEAASGLFQRLGFKFLVIILPALSIPLIGALSYVIQNGFAFTGKPLSPDFTKLNPLSGFKRLFSLNSAAELVKSILKVSVLGYVVYINVAKEWQTLPFLMDVDAAGAASYIASVSFRIMVRTVWVLALIAAIDYVYQRWQFEKGLRMTKEEVRREMKELEGDPMIKARIKSIQREYARKRMMQEVPKADVVVTNPTHLAVALRYDKEKAKAPLVVEKGAGLIAGKIREIAGRHGVPVVENKSLARTLFKHVEIGMEIPVTLYKAVAEILAYVYRLKGRVRL
ncbi:MAG: flagellar biosynthesis protein FlhB [Deltaproteobacteria bacterium]|nr:flagellar biosynthesis protein FlhB [Deltaproteobacteria bacterium]